MPPETPWLTDATGTDTATYLKHLVQTMTDTYNAGNFDPSFWTPLIHSDYQDLSNTWFTGLRGPEVFTIALRDFLAEYPDFQIRTIDMIGDVDERKGTAQVAQHTDILGSETARPSTTTWQFKRNKALQWQARSMVSVFWRDAAWLTDDVVSV